MAGATATGIDFALDVGGAIVGMVTDASSGDPLGDVHLQVYDAGGSYVTYAYTDGHSIFTLYLRPAGDE